jgi:lipopolysaccharide export system permease protein
MMAVVDSLYSEIEFQRIQTRDNKNIYPTEDYADRESYFNPNRVLSDSVAIIKSIDSKFHVPNSFEDAEIQYLFVQESIRQLKEYRSRFETAKVNIEWREKRIARYLVEIHKKLSIPFACVVFILFGAPVGIMTKRGNFGFAALISTVVLTFYWVSLIQGEKWADRLFITPLFGMWTFNAVLTIAGVYLIIQLSTGFRISDLFQKRD